MIRIILLVVFFNLIYTVHAQEVLVTDSFFITNDDNILQFTGVQLFNSDVNCRLTSYYFKTFDTVTQQLMNTQYVTMDYYSSGNKRQTVTQVWDSVSNNYFDSARTTISYIPLTARTDSTLDEVWNTNNMTWQNWALQKNSYDADEHLYQTLTQKWNNLSWQDSLRQLYMYENGYLKHTLRQIWRVNAWVDDAETTYFNNNQGLPDSSIDKNLGNNPLPIVAKSYYTYNTAKLLLRDTIKYYLNNSLFYSAVLSHTYNEYNNLVLLSLYSNAGMGSENHFAYKACGALPVKLLSFKADNQKNNVLLSWTTSSEYNSAYFDLQRSAGDYLHFISIGSLNASGNSSSQRTYKFTDNITSINNTIRNLFYRLRQVDKDGNSNYSALVSVILENDVQLYIVPNPAEDHIIILHDNSMDLNNSVLSITDMSGKTVLQQKYLSKEVSISSLAKGIYIIKLSMPSKVITRKLVIQ